MTHPLNVHGTIVYVTEQEDSFLGALFYGFGIFFGLTALLQYIGTHESSCKK